MKYIFTFLFFLASVGLSHGQAVLNQVKEAIAAGDAVVLSEHLNNPVSIKIKKKEEIYSVEQAQVALKQFFTQHPPQSFKEDYRGEGVNGQFIIGTYQCSNNKTFKIYFLVKDKKGISKVFQFFIEEE